MATYTQKPGTYYAAYWDGENSAEIDAMMTALYGNDYAGSSVDGTDLLLTGQNDLWFGAVGYVFRVESGRHLVRGPLYGGYRSDARWETLTPSVFADRFNATP